jgi:hypothetical protein
MTTSSPASTDAGTDGESAGALRTGYADVNGLHMYYEIHGSGSPVILLHGGMLTIDLNFRSLIPTLARRHQTIGVELQGHGRTADSGRPITPAALAGDVVALPGPPGHPRRPRVRSQHGRSHGPRARGQPPRPGPPCRGRLGDRATRR